MADFLQVVTAVDSEEAAGQLARGITGARLAGCVQIVGPMKSTTGRVAELEAYIKENHSYDIPEITGTVISGGSDEYLDWITAETRTDASS